MSAACCATWVPLMYMAKPTSACFSAGASLVPSPVTATTCRLNPPTWMRDFWIPVTSTSLSVGVERASTRSFGQIWSNSSWLMHFSGCSESWAVSTRERNCSPVIAISLPVLSPSSERMPALREMALAVARLSPVTMRTVMPACRHTRIAPGTSSRRGSSIPTTAIRIRSASTSSGSAPSEFAGDSCRALYAIEMVRRPRSAKAVIESSTFLRSVSSMSTTWPSAFMYFVHSVITISDAPLVKSIQGASLPSGIGTRVDMRLRLDEKEMPERPGCVSGNSLRNLL
mmetsp:Transcript_11064/g.26864  ORF Transcript_11064/g.26864 Transcript_11064/m.26864 type:complete len:285 (-) Transcript_11064:1758-2612(-)